MRTAHPVLAVALFGALVLLTRLRKRQTRTKREFALRSSSQAVVRHVERASLELGLALRVVKESGVPVDLVWTSSRRAAYSQTRIWNRVCGTRVLEDKRVMGEVFTKDLGEYYLESHSFKDLTKFEEWVSGYAGRTPSRRYWVLKDAMANGGAGLWFLDISNDASWRKVIAEAKYSRCQAGYTLQEYLPGAPLLWQGRKFHFRVAAVLTATGRAFVHRIAFVHPANNSYTSDPACFEDKSIHVTNLCVNLAFGQQDKFIGEVREDLILDRPAIWDKICDLWATTVKIMKPFMKYQRSREDFEYIGLDVIANDEGNVFLIEANCPPALSSATGYAHAEAMHDEILGNLFSTIVLPQLSEDPRPTSFGGFVEVFPGWDIDSIIFTGDFHQAQSRADLVLLRALHSRRKQSQKFEIDG